MAQVSNRVYDEGLSVIPNDATHLYICSQEPTTYAEASSTYALAVKASPEIAAPSDRSAGGREVVVAFISDGTITGSDAATHWAIVNAGGSGELLIASNLSASQTITSGNIFTLASFAIGIAAPS